MGVGDSKDAYIRHEWGRVREDLLEMLNEGSVPVSPLPAATQRQERIWLSPDLDETMEKYRRQAQVIR